MCDAIIVYYNTTFLAQRLSYTPLSCDLELNMLMNMPASICDDNSFLYEYVRIKFPKMKPGVIVYTCNLSTWRLRWEDCEFEPSSFKRVCGKVLGI